MATIPINDSLGVSIEAELAPGSALLKYAQQIPGMVLQGADLARLQALTLADPAVQSLNPKIAFKRPLELGTSAVELTVQADAGMSFAVISSKALFTDDHYGDSIAIPSGSCYVALGFEASAGADVGARTGALSLGLDAALGIEVKNYRRFSSGPDAPGLAEAFAAALGGFTLPAAPEDLASMAAGVITTVSGHGTLKFTATANLLAVANPLASLSLPSPVPSLAVKQSGGVTVGASWEISTEYQVRVQKLDTDRVRLGWYRKHGSEFTVSAAAKAGITAMLGDTDLFPTVVGAISTNAAAEHEELRNAGVPAEQVKLIGQAVKAAVDRKLQLAVAAQFGLLKEDEAAFLYEVRLSQLTAEATDALAIALRGDFSALQNADQLPAGIQEVHSILTKVRASSVAFKINLLGIFNYASISKLALQGTVTFTPSTGDLVIVDEATASRIQLSDVNFGANEEKLRHLMAESFLVTAAYRGSRTVTAPPELTSSHVYFRLDNSTSRRELGDSLAVAAALGLSAPEPPANVEEFGRTCTMAEARYDDRLTRLLFLTPEGTARTHEEYESAGRRALTVVVSPDGDDAFRLRPATDNALWNQMKTLGPPSFKQLLPEAQVPVVTTDYLTVQWWADSMRRTAEVLVTMNRAFDSTRLSPDDPQFQKLRGELAGHLKSVAANASVLFGEPWGLLAMFLACGGRADTEMHITSPRYVCSAARPLAAAN